MTDKKIIQQTLIIFKPDAVQRGIVGEILARFERVGLKIIGVKMLSPTRDQYYEHYERIGKMITRRGEKTFNANVDFMMQGPVIFVVLEGVDAVELVRKMVGTTEPKTAQVGTIRGDYSHISFGYADMTGRSTPNVIHASGNIEEAEQEIHFWFSDSETYDYQALNEKYTR